MNNMKRLQWHADAAAIMERIRGYKKALNEKDTDAPELALEVAETIDQAASALVLDMHRVLDQGGRMRKFGDAA